MDEKSAKVTKPDIRQVRANDKEWIGELIAERWGSRLVVSRGKQHRPEELPGFIAEMDGRQLGLTTYRVQNDECEIVTIDSLVPGVGIGTALLRAVIEEAVRREFSRIWLVTTNDNLDALRFFQTRGFILSAIYRNAIEAARELKPEIPSHGYDNIPIRDEIELEMNL